MICDEAGGGAAKVAVLASMGGRRTNMNGQWIVHETLRETASGVLLSLYLLPFGSTTFLANNAALYP